MSSVRDLKIKYKAGVLVAMALVTGALMFVVAAIGISNIKSSLDELVQATNVERYAYETILQEKNYLLNANASTSNKKLAAEAFETAEKDVATILKTLDSIDRTGGPAIVERSRSARKGTTAYAELYRKGVAALVELDKLTDLLEKNGETASQVAKDYIRSVGDAKKAATASDILEYTYLIRADEKRYMLNQRAETFGKMKANFASMMERLATLEKTAEGDKELQAVKKFSDAAKGYEKDAYQWVERSDLLFKDILPNMKTLGDNVIKLAFDAAQETSQSMITSRQTILMWLAIIGGGISILGIVLGVVVSSAITKPVAALTGAMSALANGDTSVAIPSIEQKEEIGTMARAVQIFKDSAIARIAMEAREKGDTTRRQERQNRMEQLTSEFDGTVVTVLENLKRGVGGLHGSSQSMSGTAEATSGQSQAAASAAEQARTNVQSVAAAGNELSSSIQEISRQVAQTASFVQGATAEAEECNTKINRLAEAADRIGEIVTLINGIASQTNLLALNATIEAARVGEAGRGFAVVAAEVKNLASQTAKATEEISSQITAMQSETTDTVAAIRGITATITKVNELTAAVASAVEEQGSATAEIARNVDQAAGGITLVADNITGVTSSATKTGAMAQEVFQAANTLQTESATLEMAVSGFLRGVRAL